MNNVSIKDVLKTPLNIKRLPDSIDLLVEKRIRVNSLNEKVLYSEISGVCDTNYSDKELIVSLTTYGKRIREVYLAIESIFQQSMLPNRIILWLSQDEFLGKQLPMLLQKQIKRGLEVRYCKDLLSYKKLIPTLKEFPNADIVTIDDDIIYPISMLEDLYSSYKDEPKAVHFNRGHKMKLKSSSKFESYTQWGWEVNDCKYDTLNFPTGCWGVLYPAGCMDPEVLNEDKFMSICRTADDIWFKAMTLKNNFGSKKAMSGSEKLFTFIDINAIEDQITPLSQTNIVLGQNDVQLENVFQCYNLYEKL
ncbi:hypothetical protein [Marinifilum flexuosum]|uniref:hypothetical protein n=1 Tax=Marinifilum flexuosum TaxID=1117708 RepID=UPI00249156B5|nr:hypothetical protein [Marinifilum flexuosum]